MCAHTHASMHVRTHTRTYTVSHTHECTHVQTHMHACIHTHTHTHTHKGVLSSLPTFTKRRQRAIVLDRSEQTRSSFTTERLPPLTLKAVPSSMMVGSWERQMSTARSQACLRGRDKRMNTNYTHNTPSVSQTPSSENMSTSNQQLPSSKTRTVCAVSSRGF